MKKPKKTLKDLLRLEAMLTKQTERTEKIVSKRRDKGDKDNPVTNVFYARLGARQKSALDDLSEIRRLIEDLSLKSAEAEEAKAEAKSKAKANGKAARETEAAEAQEAKAKESKSEQSKSEQAKSDQPKSEEGAAGDEPAKRASRSRKPAAEAQS